MVGAKSENAIIGAGMAGLACGRALYERGLKTVIFDKGRGLAAEWRPDVRTAVSSSITARNISPREEAVSPTCCTAPKPLVPWLVGRKTAIPQLVSVCPK